MTDKLYILGSPMTERSSQHYVNFIANLMPLYMHEQIDGLDCARSLGDGTILLPMHRLDEATDDDWIAVRWQGDASKSYEAQGVLIATNAVLRYVELHCIGKSLKESADLLRHMSNHFEFKTGRALYLPNNEEDSAGFKKIGEYVSRLGEQAVVEVIKKAVGW